MYFRFKFVCKNESCKAEIVMDDPVKKIVSLVLPFVTYNLWVLQVFYLPLTKLWSHEYFIDNSRSKFWTTCVLYLQLLYLLQDFYWVWFHVCNCLHGSASIFTVCFKLKGQQWVRKVVVDVCSVSVVKKKLLHISGKTQGTHIVQLYIVCLSLNFVLL
jgi:hypothetical protein